MTATTLIVIPARYGSSRLPGKPLLEIAGKTMLSRVCDIARKAASGRKGVTLAVATEDIRIKQYAETLDVHAVLTDDSCKTGSDRALQAVERMGAKPDIVINLQGDAPLTPPHFISALLDTLDADQAADAATPVVPLSWEALDNLRAHKAQSPFSGTTAIVDTENYARWFSKTIIPALRDEAKLQENEKISPVLQHVGLYAFRLETLRRFVSLPQSHYEQLESLEQLRLLEHNMRLHCVRVSYEGYPAHGGVDTEADLARAEAIIEEHGEPK